LDYTNTRDGIHKVIMLESNGQVKPIISKYLVGCDGALSRVRKKLDSREIPFYIGVQEFIRCDKVVDMAYFIFDSEITDFYSWIIPKNNLVEIGSLLDPNYSKEKFQLLKKKIATRFGISGEGSVNSALVLRPNPRRDILLGKDSVLLCGEAAGLISPSSAEGISYALRSGKCCAEAINNSVNPLKEYSKLCTVIVARLVGKHDKSKVISDKVKRKKLFSS